MRIQLNDQWHEVPSPLSLADFLATQTNLPQALATAVNSQFVPKNERATYVLKDGDRIFGFSPITGG